MRKFLRSTVFLLLFVIITACGGESLPTPPPIEDGDSLLSALEGAGAKLREVDPDIPEIEGAFSRAYELNRELLLFYEFKNEEAQESYTETFRDASGDQGALFAEDAGLWRSGKLLVVYEGKDGGTVLLLGGFLGDPLVPPQTEFDEPYPPAVVAAIYLVADDVGVDPTSVEVVSAKPVIWPDSCLMYPEQGEECTEAETTGWRVVLSINGESVEVHTDELGENVRWR